jgi:hypothetical protein
MKIELQRRLDVESWEMKATVAFPQRRDEVQAVLALTGQRGHLTAADLVHREHGLLPGRAEIMGARLLTMVSDLKLLEQKGDQWLLTDLGRSSLDEGRTYVPEEDLWQMHWTEDPLVQSPLLSVERIMTKGNDRWNHDKRPTAPTSRWTSRKPVVHELLKEVNKTRRVRVDDLQKNGHLIGRNSLGVSIVAEPGQQASLHVQGNLPTHGGDTTSIDHRRSLQDVRHEHLLSQLLHDAPRGSWNGQALEIAFEATSFKERRTQMATVTIDQPDLDNLGAFDVVQIRDVPLLPATPEDAWAWAKWLLWDEWKETPWPEAQRSRWTALCDSLGVTDASRASQPGLRERVMDLIVKGIERTPTESMALMRAQAVMDLGGGEA